MPIQSILLSLWFLLTPSIVFSACVADRSSGCEIYEDSDDRKLFEVVAPNGMKLLTFSLANGAWDVITSGYYKSMMLNNINNSNTNGFDGTDVINTITGDPGTGVPYREVTRTRNFIEIESSEYPEVAPRYRLYDGHCEMIMNNQTQNIPAGQWVR